MRAIRDRARSRLGIYHITAWQGVNVDISSKGVWIIDAIRYRVWSVSRTTASSV
jgi:hypothetical protein